MSMFCMKSENIQNLNGKHFTFYWKIFYILLENVLHFAKNILHFAGKKFTFYSRIMYNSLENILHFTGKHSTFYSWEMF